eukprot:COSAG02_NODE_14043_length_1318_cov_1.195242_1_plen_53_part_01
MTLTLGGVLVHVEIIAVYHGLVVLIASNIPKFEPLEHSNDRIHLAIHFLLQLI